MNDQDKEAFEDYMEENKSIYFGMPEWEKDTDRTIWQAACEYKQKEIDLIQSQLDYSARILIDVQADKSTLRAEIKKFQAENAKLRECIKFYGDFKNYQNYTYYHDCGMVKCPMIDYDCGNKARQVLKELDLN